MMTTAGWLRYLKKVSQRNVEGVPVADTVWLVSVRPRMNFTPCAHSWLWCLCFELHISATGNWKQIVNQVCWYTASYKNSSPHPCPWCSICELWVKPVVDFTLDVYNHNGANLEAEEAVECCLLMLPARLYIRDREGFFCQGPFGCIFIYHR